MEARNYGPWIVGSEDDSDFFLVGPDNNGLVTAPIMRTHDEQLANLIAAAPELLEALWLCFDHCRLYYPEVEHNNVGDAVRAAIAKATGSTA